MGSLLHIWSLKMTSKIVKKTLEEAHGVPNAEIDFSDKSLVHMDDMNRLWTMRNITRLTLSHNKISELPPAIANLENMEILNLFNNSLTEVPQSFSVLEVLDLSYNMLNEDSLPENFFMLHTLRALYLSDNDFELLSPKIKNMVNLRILAIRDNELIEIPEEIGALSNIRELHLQGNRLTVLPPSVGQLDFQSSRKILKLDNNPWVPPIEDQLILGVSYVIEYIRTETYKYLYSRHIQANVPPPERSEKVSKRSLSRKNSRA